MENPVTTLTQEIRKQVRLARKTLTKTEQQQASQQLLNRLCQHKKILAAQHLSLTLPFDGEIDLTPFIHWCWENNKNLYLPVVDPEQQGNLLFIAYQTTTQMQTNRYGIKEPVLLSNKSGDGYCNTVSVSQLDIVITPLVAFDKFGHRIGMGGGYYDRLLAPWHQSKIGPYPMGVAHNCQYQENLPTQEWDVPLPEILTPDQHYQF